MSDEDLYNLAAEIMLFLQSISGTTIRQCLNRVLRNDGEKIAKGKVTCAELRNTVCETLKGDRKTDLDSILLYLLAVDYATDTLETDLFTVKGDALLTEGVTLNTLQQDAIEIFRTYPGVDRNGVANEKYTCVFKNLVFYIKKNEFYRNLVIDNVYISEADEEPYESFKIGFAPYPHAVPMCRKETKDEKIYLESPTDRKKCDDIFLQKCGDLARECDMIFGPEVHGSEFLDAELYNLLYDENCKVVFCPSYYKIREDTVENSAMLYVRQEPHYLRHYVDKCHPAEFNNGDIEALTQKPKYHVSLLHVRGIGRILCLICKDAITQDFADLINMLNVDIVVVQCYTQVLSTFLDHAAEFSYKRCVIIGNSCHAIRSKQPGKEGYVYPLTVIRYNEQHTAWETSMQKTCDYCDTVNCSENKCAKIVEIAAESGKTDVLQQK